MNNSLSNTYQIELVKRICDGDISAFHEIVEMYKKKVYYIAYDICGDFHEAEDISQEVFIKVFRFIDKFKLDAKFSTWIYRVAVNTAIDAVRKHKKKQISMETTQMDSLPAHSTETGPENHQAARDLLQKALPALSQKERTVFTMRYFNEFKLVQIAEIMNISINTIKTLLLRAKKKLRKKLAPYNQDLAWTINPEVPYE